MSTNDNKHVQSIAEMCPGCYTDGCNSCEFICTKCKENLCGKCKEEKKWPCALCESNGFDEKNITAHRCKFYKDGKCGTYSVTNKKLYCKDKTRIVNWAKFIPLK